VCVFPGAVKKDAEEFASVSHRQLREHGYQCCLLLLVLLCRSGSRSSAWCWCRWCSNERFESVLTCLLRDVKDDMQRFFTKLMQKSFLAAYCNINPSV